MNSEYESRHEDHELKYLDALDQRKPYSRKEIDCEQRERSQRDVDRGLAVVAVT